MYLGIDAGETHRAYRGKYLKKGIVRTYPLIDYGLDRDECKKIIRQHKFMLPDKSGCFICPFMKARQFREMAEKYPDLIEKRRYLEKVASERAGRQVSISPTATTDELLKKWIDPVFDKNQTSLW